MAGKTSSSLNGLKIAILVDNGFLDIEMTSPREALDGAGATTHLIAPGNQGSVKAWHHQGEENDWGQTFKVDVPLDQADASRYDGLLIPGGVMSPDSLRTNQRALAFVRAFFDAGKPVAAICHGPQVLINADVVDGRRMTSYKAIARDLENAGAEWVDDPCVTDQGLVTSRSPDDLEHFNPKIIEEYAEGVHTGQHA